MSCSLFLRKPVVKFAVLLIAYQSLASIGWADLRPHYGDGAVIDRSTVIAIGHIKQGTVRRIGHRGGGSHEYHATIVINKVLKGTLDEPTVTLLVQHGLQVETVDQKIEIGDQSTSPIRISPIVADARQDQIWFLRKIRSGDGAPDAPVMWGIRDPEDVHNIRLTDYFKILLSDQPEAGVHNLLSRRPDIAERAVEYLEYRDVQKILKLPDPAVRFQKLLPYYLGAIHDNTHSSVRRAIIDGGPASGPYLMAAFHNVTYQRRRREFIQIWAWTGYTGCADLLLDLLNKNYFQYVRLRSRLEREKEKSKIDPRSLGRLADEVAITMFAFGEIEIPNAAQAIAETRKRWQNIETYRGAILENCDRATQRIEERANRRSN